MRHADTHASRGSVVANRPPDRGARSARATVAACLGLCWAAAGPAAAAEPRIVGHWELAGDGADSSGNGLHAKSHGVEFRSKGPDGPPPGATFDGRDSRLTVGSATGLKLGTGDFTLALWVHCNEDSGDRPGDLVTLYDPRKRVGFNLSLRTNTGVTTSQPNVRQLQFGIDAGTEPTWADEGRPGNAILAFALVVHDGDLYAGTCGNGKADVGRVYRYEGPGKWADCGAPDKCNAVSAMAVYQGKLYAATAKYRFAGSALPESGNPNRGGGVYRYDGGTKWTEVGRLPDTEAVGGLAVYKGRLYASSLYKPAGFFRYEADGRWTALPVPDGKRVESLAVFDGFLWATSYDGGRVYRYDGTAWKDYGRLGDNTQTYSFAAYRGRLCVGTWPSGKVYRLAAGDTWEDMGRLGEELEVMGMVVHNGQLYAGTLPSAEVYRHDGGRTWTRTARLDRTPDVKYRRAWTMALYRGRLFCSTLPSGRVHSLTAGVCVTHDRELPAGWRHVAAVRRGGVLELYVDGKPVAKSVRFDPARFDLTTDGPLVIGAGGGGSFRGSLRDVRLYSGALDGDAIARLGRVKAAGVEKALRTGTAGKDQVVEIEVALPDAARSAGALQALRAALAAGPASLTELAGRDFARVPLTRTDAATARALLWEAHAAFVRKHRTGEIKDRVLKDGKLEMPFSFTTFGKKPAGGRSLWISLHGGGNAPRRVNDRQWENQKKLYTLDEGIYLAPRAPTNTWNLWHEPHIDRLFGRLIEDLIVLEGVNPDRVYVLGYSAGGDGVYQLAPRMADRWAAAGMMAGHPNGVSLLSLRNVPFALQVGGEDAAYIRNTVAKEYGERLDELRKDDPEGYRHFVKVHEGKGHWMDREDRVALPWMAKFTRDPIPERVVWKQTGTPHDRSYWLAVPPNEGKVGSLVAARRDGQAVEITAAENVKRLLIRLDDRTADLDRPVTVTHAGKELFAGTLSRTVRVMVETLAGRGDPGLMFDAEVGVDLPAGE